MIFKGGKEKKISNGETERMTRALKHLEGDRKRIAKCKRERGAGSQGKTHWQRMREAGGVGGGVG